MAPVALVTGSSRGLGAVIARRLARDGFAVAVNGRPGDQLAAGVVQVIRDNGGVAGEFLADVTDEPEVAGLAAAVADRLGPVDVLVVNATGSQPEAAVTDVVWADHLAQLDFFVKSPLLLGRVLLPGMQARRYGRIVHIDSEVAHRPPVRPIGVRGRQERPDRADSELGARAGPVRHHGEHGRTRLHPGGAARGGA